jgi:hypothetical protein
VLEVDYMPVVVVENGVFMLTRLAWLSEEALGIQEAAVECLGARANHFKYRESYPLK